MPYAALVFLPFLLSGHTDSGSSTVPVVGEYHFVPTRPRCESSRRSLFVCPNTHYVANELDREKASLSRIVEWHAALYWGRSRCPRCTTCTTITESKDTLPSPEGRHSVGRQVRSRCLPYKDTVHSCLAIPRVQQRSQTQHHHPCASHRHTLEAMCMQAIARGMKIPESVSHKLLPVER